MKKIYFLLVACFMLGNISAQSVREAGRPSGWDNYYNGHHQPRVNHGKPAAIAIRPSEHYPNHYHGEEYVRAMSHEAFRSAKHQITSQSFDSSRLEVAKQITSWNNMTAAQIREIATTFSFDFNRLEYAKFAFSYCINQGEYFILYDVFNFSSNAEELSRHIGHR